MKAFCCLMLLQIFNICIDPPDLYPEYIAEDLNYNEMESIVEIILEKCIALGDVITETDDDDTKQMIKNNTVTLIQLIPNNHSRELFEVIVESLYRSYILVEFDLPNQFKADLETPPPKV